MKNALWAALIVLTTSFFLGVRADDSELQFKGQKQSVTPWDNLSADHLLNVKEWREEEDMRAQVEEAERVVRERNHREVVGHIFQCVGTCRVDRGDGFFNGSYRTRIYEADEVQTMGDSYAWVFLLDGTMVRLSPFSSVTFNEFNIGIKENFINARVNAGNVLWLSRHENTFQEANIRETDVIFFPYAEYEALPITEEKPYIEKDLLELINPTETQLDHYKTLNLKIGLNNKMTKGKPTYAFIVMPNATLMGMSPSVEMISLMGGAAYFRKRSSDLLGEVKNEGESNEVLMQLRGFDNKELTPLQDDTWMMVDDKGKAATPADDRHWLDMTSFITKRIPSIMHGREIFLERYSEFVFREKYDAVALAEKDGYLLWGKLKAGEGEKKSNMELRLEFLKEYYRRIETSNLNSSARVRENLIARGETNLKMELGTYFFSTALNRYYQYGEILKENSEKNSDDKEVSEVLNSTKKILWKKMHGIR
jgi:hypothetical protein